MWTNREKRHSPTSPAPEPDPCAESSSATPPHSIRYRHLGGYLKKRFGCRVYRVPLDGGFTCPNRDGRRGFGGCLFCDAGGSAARPERVGTPIRDQMDTGMAWLRRRYGARKFLAYFQSFTGTDAPPDRLRALYDQALAGPDVVGLCIGTRPDCVAEPVLDLLEEYNRRCYVLVELGLESVRDDTLNAMNRGHTVEEFRDAVRRTRARRLPVCAHLILGFPGEGRPEVDRAATELNRLGVEGIKIHLLHVLRGSPLESIHRRQPFPLLERAEYVSLVVDLLERLRPDIVIHRLTGEAPPDRLVAPRWCLDRNAVVEAIRSELDRRRTWQGKRYMTR